MPGRAKHCMANCMIRYTRATPLWITHEVIQPVAMVVFRLGAHPLPCGVKSRVTLDRRTECLLVLV